ncbi:cell wall binding repeat-containing protein [Clostridium sp. DL-VIII]|uniref:N-acetylmuramoyl-L-alanine amidase family protein n=1 Tax=Clostridium sp. DL-VIII TaxID=641107 RepID=UPI00023B078F|nr:N-acetylmuramoyl-L-alanine amidase family protein [Clostridium sp. DL-VIII]EHJ02147.1 cell wall binding repeat-containing protein [Clostridium sp. DL-VIII]
MFKRANKITALLVAAASVMSVVPAMASDKLGTKDGTIDNAVAFSDGKYAYQGYRTDDDDLGIYYNDGSKDKALDDVEDADLEGSFQDKYAYAKDGDDEYLVDMTNGDVSDDDTPEDQYDTAKTKLKSKLAKTDRYDDVNSTEDIDFLDKDGNAVDGNDDAYKAVYSTKFGEDWYAYSVNSNEDNAKTGKLYGFTNEDGKYVDVSNLANIYAYSTKEGKYVKIEEYDDYDKDAGLTASLAAAPKLLAQDKDNLYILVNVNIFDSSENAKVTGTTTGSAVATDGFKTITKNTDGSVVGVTNRYFIQKVAKAQGDQKDDAYLPKEVSSYEVTKGELDCGDADDAYDAIFTDNREVKDDTTFSVANGQLLAIRYDEGKDNVKVTSINFKKDKVKYLDDSDSDTAKRPYDEDHNGIFDKDDKVDVYLAEKDDDDDVDVDDDIDNDGHSGLPYDTDVDGNVWVVADGKIYEFANNEMTKKYSVDSSLNVLSVYDEKNIITWEQDGDIYTTVTEGAAETASDATPAAPATVGWSQAADGTWTFFDATGTKVVNNWVNYQGAWYFLKADGVMATGWQQVGSTWYYLNASGAMATGWVNDGGTWYYLQSSGAMATGWLNDNGTWYYLNASGAMLANTTVDGYVLGASGAWIQ